MIDDKTKYLVAAVLTMPVAQIILGVVGGMLLAQLVKWMRKRRVKK